MNEVYRDSERWRYEPPACPGCGHRVRQDWVDVTSAMQDDPERRFIPGRWECHTQGCAYGPQVPAVFELNWKQPDWTPVDPEAQ